MGGLVLVALVVLAFAGWRLATYRARYGRWMEQNLERQRPGDRWAPLDDEQP